MNGLLSLPGKGHYAAATVTSHRRASKAEEEMHGGSTKTSLPTLFHVPEIVERKKVAPISPKKVGAAETWVAAGFEGRLRRSR